MAIARTTYAVALAASPYQVFDGPGLLFGILAISNGTVACSAKVHDIATGGSAADGNLVGQAAVAATTAEPDYQPFDHPIRVQAGMNLVIAGTGAKAIVYFKKG